MQLAEQLRAAGLLVFPCWARYNATKNRWDKGPSVPRGESWKLTSYRPIDDPALDWSSGVVGLPIPPRVLLLDLDTYKGVTRAEAEAYLGCSPDWDRALIQRTIGGGDHYAFLCDWDARQLQGDGLRGLDTRAAGKGFICTGQGYSPIGVGVYAMTRPDSLPAIPDAARTILEVVAAPALPPAVIPETDQTEQVIAALRHIDPGINRAEWVRIGMALRHQFQDDPSLGQDVFDQWSSGELWPGAPPENYVAEDIPGQWGSFKAEGGVTVATLFYRAIQAGWAPPSTFDTTAAFGPGAASATVFDAMVERVQDSGGDVKQTGAIVDEIKAAGCNALQVALLAAELKNALKDAGIKDRAVAGHIDALLRTKPVDMFERSEPGVYGKNDTDNAAIFLDRHYPGGTLLKCDGVLYAYTGKVWEETTVEALKHRVALDMSQLRLQTSRINSCIDLVLKLIPVYDGAINRMAERRIIFDNGVLDVDSGRLDPHSKYYYSTILLPYDYAPGAACPMWLDFLSEVLDGDQERIGLLQEWLGYQLVNDYRHHKAMLLLGPPRCGKGTIGRILQQLVGDVNFSGGSLSSLARDSFIESIRNKPVLFVGDAAKKLPPAVVNQVIERIKSISGNDAIDFDRKYVRGLSETLPTRITIAANSVPNLFDDSGALASRIIVLPFYRSWLGREDLELQDKLTPELPGIAVWALEGLRRLQQNGRFVEPAASVEELTQIRESYSPLMQFINDACTMGAGALCTSGDLYAVYRAWCVNQGEDLLRPKVFVSAVKDATRGKGVHYGPHRFPDGNVARGFTGIAPLGEAPTTAAAFTVVK